MLTTLAMLVSLWAPAAAVANCWSANPLPGNATLSSHQQFTPAIFVGTVKKIQNKMVTIRVLRAFRGPDTGEITLAQFPQDPCRYPFQEGLTYLVHGFRQMDGSISAFNYAGTEWVPRAEKALRWLELSTQYGWFGPFWAKFKLGDVPITFPPPSASRCQELNLSREQLAQKENCEACVQRSQDATQNLSEEFRNRKEKCTACSQTLPFPINLAEGIPARVVEACPICEEMAFAYRPTTEVAEETPLCVACREGNVLASLQEALDNRRSACGLRERDCEYVAEPAARAQCDLEERQRLATAWRLPWLAKP